MVEVGKKEESYENARIREKDSNFEGLNRSFVMFLSINIFHSGLNVNTIVYLPIIKQTLSV